MCGRFAATTDPARLAVLLDAVDETGAAGIRPPNYNVAPTTYIVAVVARHSPAEPDGDPSAASRRIRLMRWGLLPPWAKPGPDGTPQAKGSHLINARAETVTTSPAYRTAARRKRCLIPMDGYYEWKRAADIGRTGNLKRGGKTPYYFFRPDGQPMMVAGLWSVWRADSAGRSGHPILTCTAITTEAVGQFADVHDRMPLSLAEPDWARWLDPDSPAPADLLSAPPDVDMMTVREVSTLVNNVANNGPELIEPPESDNQPVGLF